MTTAHSKLRGLAVAGAIFVAMLTAPVASASPRHVAATSSNLSVPNGVYGSSTVATSSGDVWIFSTCYQSGSAVIFNRVQAVNGQATLQLGPTGGYTSGVGGADCPTDARTWNAKRQRWTTVATTTFHVSD